jgi:hypothetical protein
MGAAASATVSVAASVTGLTTSAAAGFDVTAASVTDSAVRRPVLPPTGGRGDGACGVPTVFATGLATEGPASGRVGDGRPRRAWRPRRRQAHRGADLGECGDRLTTPPVAGATVSVTGVTAVSTTGVRVFTTGLTTRRR